MLYMALIFVVSSRPRPESLDDTPDVLLHASAYFALALLAVRATGRGLRKAASPAAFIGGLGLAVAYGASDEWHQSWVPERTGSWADVGYDALGVSLAGLMLFVFWHVLGDRK